MIILEFTGKPNKFIKFDKSFTELLNQVDKITIGNNADGVVDKLYEHFKTESNEITKYSFMIGNKKTQKAMFYLNGILFNNDFVNFKK